MSKIPEGATHTAPDGTYRMARGSLWYGYADGDWVYIEGAAPHCYTKILAQPGWSGDGLPPVGVEIEAKHKDATPEWARPDFYKTEIVAIGKQLVIFAAEANGCETVGKIEDYEFRPVRTPEQIESESRKDFLARAHKIYMEGAADHRGGIMALYDAGLRFVEVTK